MATSQPMPSFPSPPLRLAPKMTWRLVTPALPSTRCSRLKTSVIIYFSKARVPYGCFSFLHRTHVIQWHFSCILFTERHRCIQFLKSTNLHGLSKINLWQKNRHNRDYCVDKVSKNPEKNTQGLKRPDVIQSSVKSFQLKQMRKTRKV